MDTIQTLKPTKICSRCKEQKYKSEFYFNLTKKGFESRCKDCVKECARKWSLKNKDKKKENNRSWAESNSDKVAISTKKYRTYNPDAQRSSNLKKYGISIEQYNQMFVDQNGLCAICEQPQKVSRNLYVDHDHVSKQVRGLLCHTCNFGLGQFKDSQDFLFKAIVYLKKYG